MISEAIKTLFDALPHSDFYNSMNGKLYCGEVKFSAASLPYCVSDRVDQKPMFWFDNDGEDYLWRFKIYDKNKLVVEDYEQQLHELYDEADLVVAGYHTMRMERKNSRTMRVEQAWCSITTYRIKIDRS